MIGDLSPWQLERPRPVSQLDQLLNVNIVPRRIDVLVDSDEGRRHYADAGETRSRHVREHRCAGVEQSVPHLIKAGTQTDCHQNDGSTRGDLVALARISRI